MRSSEKKSNYSQLPETTMDAFVHFDMDDRILEINIFLIICSAIRQENYTTAATVT